MSFSAYLASQLEKHPSMQPRDIVKLCYQAAFGAEHLLADISAAAAYLDEELSNVSPADGALYEQISDGVCRINLAVWKAKGLPSKWLLKMFAASASISPNGEENFLTYLGEADALISGCDCAFSGEVWQSFKSEYLAGGIRAVHHSDTYREAEKPAYRIVSSRYIRLLPLLERINSMSAGEVFVIAIDGRAASGKSSAAALLAPLIDADTVHMDDFFLPPELRNDARLAEPGGNVHYERFIEEVLPRLRCAEPFAYRIFDCGIMDYEGEQAIKSRPYRIVEGSYSTHPLFGDYADLKLFSDIDYTEQLRRILLRDGEQFAERFKNTWIPLEERYFEHFDVKNRADLIL